MKDVSHLCKVQIGLFTFVHLSSHLCVFLALCADVLPGFKKAIYNSLKRNLHRFSV